MSAALAHVKDFTTFPPAFAIQCMTNLRQKHAHRHARLSDRLTTVKVCGIVSAEDAKLVARTARRNLDPQIQLFLGMILSPVSKRKVSVEVAKDIVEVARENGAVPVGVFVHEAYEEISGVCEKCGIDVAQLHGDGSRASARRFTGPSDLQLIDVIDVAGNGIPLVNSNVLAHGFLPPERLMWNLYDHKGGGTGHAFNWDNFKPPNEPWLLAGGLGPENVAEAIRILRPTGVDVASRVSKVDGCRKHPDKLRVFFEQVMSASAQE